MEEGPKSRRPSLGVAVAVVVAGLLAPQARADFLVGRIGGDDGQVVPSSATPQANVHGVLLPFPHYNSVHEDPGEPPGDGREEAAPEEESVSASKSSFRGIAGAGLAAVILFYPPSYLTSPPKNEVTPTPTVPAPPPTIPTPPPPPPPSPPGGNQPPPEQPPPASQPEPATLISGLVGSGLVGLFALYRRRRTGRRQPTE